MNASDTIIPAEQVTRGALRDDAFDALVQEWGIDEARVAYSALCGRLLQQLADRSRDRDWRKRAVHLQACSAARVHVLNHRIRARNKAESATVEATSRKWSTFAERLAQALYLVDPAALREVVGPGDGAIDAEEWLHERRAAAARKAARQ